MGNEPASLLVYLFASIHYTNPTNVKRLNPSGLFFVVTHMTPKKVYGVKFKKILAGKTCRFFFVKLIN